MTDYPDGFGVPRPSAQWEIAPLSALRRGLPILLAAALVCAGLGWGLARLRAPTYTSKVEIGLQPLPGAPLSNASRTNLQQQAAMSAEVESVASDTVVRAASRSLSMPADAVRSELHAEVVTNTNDLVVEFTAATPERARRGALAVADSFLQARTAAARQRLVVHVRHAATQVATARQHLAQAPSLRSRLIAYASRIQVFEPEVRDLRTVHLAAGSIVSGPSTPPAVSALRPVRAPVAGGVFGLLLAVGAVLWRSRRATRVRSDSLTAIDGCRVLVALPGAPDRDEPASANAYRTVGAIVAGSPARILAVCALTPDDGASQDVVRELNRSLARAPARVVQLGASQVAPRSGPRLRAHLRGLSAAHDVVLVAGPAATSEDGEAVAVAAGHVLLTVREGVPLRRCHEVITRLRGLAVTVLGVVVLPAGPGGA